MQDPFVGAGRTMTEQGVGVGEGCGGCQRQGGTKLNGLAVGKGDCRRAHIGQLGLTGLMPTGRERNTVLISFICLNADVQETGKVSLSSLVTATTAWKWIHEPEAGRDGQTDT